MKLNFTHYCQAHKTLGVGGFPFVRPAVAIRGLYDCTVNIEWKRETSLTLYIYQIPNNISLKLIGYSALP